MKVPRGNIIIHILSIVGLAALLVLCMLYPFLPGAYDPLALPLSTTVQVFGVIGWPLALVGVLGSTMPGHSHVFLIVSIAIATFIGLVLSIFALSSVGKAFGVLTIAAWVYITTRLIRKLKYPKDATANNFNPASLYLIVLPVLTLICQLVFLTPVTQWSRSRAILNANALIADIEDYYTKHGQYPLSLHAQHKDYSPGVVGVEKYFYAPEGKGYNLSFEQPKFILDRIGTREWVVYNPRNEHKLYSHASWLLLSPGAFERSQGWYASGETGHWRWKYFLFD